MDKIDARWGYGIFVGVRTKSGELWIATTNGVTRARSVRRIPVGGVCKVGKECSVASLQGPAGCGRRHTGREGCGEHDSCGTARWILARMCGLIELVPGSGKTATYRGVQGSFCGGLEGGR